jgi:hypothetical protein
VVRLGFAHAAPLINLKPCADSGQAWVALKGSPPYHLANLACKILGEKVVLAAVLARVAAL